VKGTIQEIYKFLCENEDIKEKDFNKMVSTSDTVQEFNDNLKIMHCTYQINLLQRSDIVFLRYSEILPEEHFAVLANISIPSEIPPIEGCFRVERLCGWILRGIPNSTKSQVSYITAMCLKSSMWSTMATYSAENVIGKHATRVAKLRTIFEPRLNRSQSVQKFSTIVNT